MGGLRCVQGRGRVDIDIKPHIVETWKLSTDPQFLKKVRDVVGLYMAPPENVLVLCVDEKSQIQAGPDRPCLPMLPKTPARTTHWQPDRLAVARLLPGRRAAAARPGCGMRCRCPRRWC